jgi:ADP-ribose pyrophosphatase YjhB (NUDIX family)
MKTFVIVVGFVTQEEQVLLVKRSQDRKHAPGLWEPVGGFLRRYESMEQAVRRRVLECAGMQSEIVHTGATFECEDAGAWWVVKPYLLAPSRAGCRVVLGPGHSDHRWVTPEQALALNCVDGLREDFLALGLLTPVAQV